MKWYVWDSRYKRWLGYYLAASSAFAGLQALLHPLRPVAMLTLAVLFSVGVYLIIANPHEHR